MENGGSRVKYTQYLAEPPPSFDLSSALMVLLAYMHGLRAVEVPDLRLGQVDFKTAPRATPPRASRV